MGLGFPSLYLPDGLGAAAITEADYSKQFSEEFRITSSGDTRFKWLVGSFYSSFESDWDLVSTIPGLINQGFGTSDLIGQTAALSRHPDRGLRRGVVQHHRPTEADDRAALVLLPVAVQHRRIRLRRPDRHNSYFYQRNSENDEGFNPKFDLSYDVDKDLMVYASATKGFRPGGGNQPIPTNPNTGLGSACLAALEAFGKTAAPSGYAPDSVWSYETGEKAKLLDNRVTVDSDFYYENWTGVQQEIALSCGFPYFDNTGKARIYGSEVEVHAVIMPGLVATASGAYTDAHLTESSTATGLSSGARLQDVPTWTASAQLSYSTDLTDTIGLGVHLENDYVGTRRDATFSPVHDLPAYDLTNLRIGLETETWTSYLFANNLFDKKAWIADNNSLSINLPTFNRLRPTSR
ncbi:MAG: TonB-dependent receptor [Aliidongia sp.]